MNNVCIFSYGKVAHDITAIHYYSLNCNKSAIWADTNIRLTLKTTAQSAIWADADIYLSIIMKNTAWIVRKLYKIK